MKTIIIVFVLLLTLSNMMAQSDGNFLGVNVGLFRPPTGGGIALEKYNQDLNSLNLLLENLDLLQGPNVGRCFRQVNGETNYIFDYTNGWSRLQGEVLQTLPEGILLKREEKLDCFIEGYPYQIVDGQEVKVFMAKEAGVYSFTATSGGLRTVQKYIFGKAAWPTQLMVDKEINSVSNQIAISPLILKARADTIAAKKALKSANAGKIKALASNQTAADKGDAYGLMRMGERYRDGEGVDKDLAKAKEYLQKATDAGSETAAEELSKLNP